MYVSTFTNNCGEKAVFIQHHDEPWPWVFHDDTLIDERPIVMKAPPEKAGFGMWSVGKGTLLGPEEATWATLCWKASQSLRTRFLTHLHTLAAEDNLDKRGHEILSELEAAGNQAVT